MKMNWIPRKPKNSSGAAVNLPDSSLFDLFLNYLRQIWMTWRIQQVYLFQSL